jgi:sulfur-carrier protein adenylyltransferase/sulfurtransferase
MSTESENSGRADLSPQELSRYERHLVLPQVGLQGQKKLKVSRVLLVGSGGLGSPVAMYLAAAGVGTLGIVDFDKVDESNLQRQLLHGVGDVGRPKTDSARDSLKELNPFVDILTHELSLDSGNALRLMEGYDIVVDGTDNFSTRYLVNDACVMLGLPNVHGSIFRFQGQVSLFHAAGGGPCYRCLHPEPPPSYLVPSCAEGGVLGVLPGVIGCLQATETIKWLLGVGQSLSGRLLTFDALAMRFREMSIPKAITCPVCSSTPTITELVDYEKACSVDAAEGRLPDVTPAEFLAEWTAGRRSLLLDVRESYEWEIVNLEDYDAKLVPLGELGQHAKSLPKEADIVVYCKSGGRGAKAQRMLIEFGFARVRNLRGGMLRWAEESS